MSINLAIAETKFSVPTSFHSLIHRQRLHTLLTMNVRHPVTLLSAPAGYGKTSLLSQWALTASIQPHLAWLSLDASDDDPYRFWLCLFFALQRRVPDVMNPLVRLLQEEQHNLDIQSLLSLLINRLLNIAEARYFLIIDDYQVITHPSIHEGLTYLIEHLPPQLRLVLATRMNPPLPLHRLLARGQLQQVSAEHLRCTPMEASVFLHEVMGLPLTNEEVEQITEHTEGWLVGLQLIALSMQGQTSLSEVLTYPFGNQRSIFGYLIEEVLRQQPEPLQRFLLVTSLLEQFNIPLCDVLCEGGQSQEMLDMLERKHLFVMSLDGEGIWYRYHPLFAESLRQRLQLSTPPQQIAALHVKASVWYAEQGLLHEAVQSAVLARDWQRVILLLGHFSRNLRWQPGEVQRMQWWIEQLPNEQFDQHPRLGLFAAWLWECTGDLRTSQHWLDQVESVLLKMSDDDIYQQLWAELLVRRAIHKGMYGQEEETRALYEQAKPFLANATIYMHALLKHGEALVSFVRGEMKESISALQECVSRYEQIGASIAARCLSSTTSSSLIMLGQVRKAEHVLALIPLEPVDERKRPCLSRGVLYASKAALLYEQNQLDQAFEHAQASVQLISKAGALLFIDRAYIVLLQIYLAREQFEAAEEMMQRLLALPVYWENAYIQAWQLAGLRVRLWLLEGNQKQAVQWRKFSQDQVSHSSPFAQERVAVAQIRVLIAERKSEEACELIATWLPQARRAERLEHVLELCLLQALAFWQLHREQDAFHALEEALTIGEQEGFLRHFLDEGNHLVSLLKRYRVHHSRSFVDRILEEFPRDTLPTLLEKTPPLHAHVLIEPLSSREREVLEVMRQGASNREIAQMLVITPNTVKRHIHTILSKLGVRNRTQAVTRAQQLGLLSKKFSDVS